MKKLIFIFFLFPNIILIGQDKYCTSLLVEDIQDTLRERYYHLLSYNLIDGVLVSKDTILVLKHSSKNGVIYKNRYLATGRGSVIDLIKKKIIAESSYRLYSNYKDTILFTSENNKCFYCFDFNKKEFIKCKNRFYINNTIHYSPDGKHAISTMDKGLFTVGNIYLYDKNSLLDTIAKGISAGYLSMECSSLNRPIPLLWIDNVSFIYASANFSNKYNKVSPKPNQINYQSFNIILANVNNKKEYIATIDSIPISCGRYKFSMNNEGDVFFPNSSNKYLIDLESKKAIRKYINDVGNSFSISISANEKFEKTIKYKNKEIGKLHIDPHNQPKTIDEYICSGTIKNGNTSKRCKEIKIWNAITEKWITIKPHYMSNIIGWIKK